MANPELPGERIRGLLALAWGGSRCAARDLCRIFHEDILSGATPDPHLLKYIAENLEQADSADDPRWIWGRPRKRGEKRSDIDAIERQFQWARKWRDMKAAGIRGIRDEFDYARQDAIDDGRSKEELARDFPCGKTAEAAYGRWSDVPDLVDCIRQAAAAAEEQIQGEEGQAAQPDQHKRSEYGR